MRSTSIAIQRATRGRVRRAPTILSGKCPRCAFAASSSASIFTAAGAPPTPQWSARHAAPVASRTSVPTASGRLSLRYCRREQRRGFFFGLFGRQDGDPVEQRGHDPNPGYVVLGALVRYLDEQVGSMPETPTLITAFNQVARGDYRLIKMPGTAYGLCRMFDVLLERKETRFLDLGNVRLALKNIQSASDSIHVKLGVFLFDHIYEYEKDTEKRLKASSQFVKLLSNQRKYDMAIAVCKQALEENEDLLGASLMWRHIMSAYVEEEDEAGLLALIDIMKEVKVRLVDLHYERLMALYMRKNDFSKVKEVYDQITEDKVLIIHPKIYKDIMEFYIKAKDQPGVVDWGNDVLKGLLACYANGSGHLMLKNESNKELWDLAVQWCVAAGRSIDDIERLMRAVSTHPAVGFKPDIETVNGLVEFSLERGDAYKAERLATLAPKWQFEPNRRSLILQMRTRILGGDVGGARLSWQEFCFREVPANDKGLETLEMLRALCEQPKVDPQHVLEVHNFIRQRMIPLDVETLCVYLRYMMRDLDIGEFVDVLTRDVQQFMPEEREQVIETISEHIVADTTTENEAWELYKVLKDVLVEMTVDVRRKLMNSFFRRDRIDMASIVFTHMRHSGHSPPNKQAYIECINGVAQSRDGRILMEMLNLLKIDPDIELDTELRNAVIWGYRLCGFPHKAMEVYGDIRRSEEGPDSDTLSAVIATCGEIPNGMRDGERIWKEFGTMGFKYTEHNYAMYLEGWIHNGFVDVALDRAKNMEGNMDIRPGGTTLYTLYTEIPPSRREELMEWIKAEYPEEWEQLLADQNQPIQNYHARSEKLAELRRQEEIENEL